MQIFIYFSVLKFILKVLYFIENNMKKQKKIVLSSFPLNRFLFFWFLSKKDEALSNSSQALLLAKME